MGLAERWSRLEPILPGGEGYPGLGIWALSTYLSASAESPPDAVRRASFPTRWVPGCHSYAQPEESLTESGRATPEETPSEGGRPTLAELGIPPASVINLSGRNHDHWDWEPRADPELIALPPFYNWQQDADGHVFIIVEGQRRYLLRDRRIEAR